MSDTSPRFRPALAIEGGKISYGVADARETGRFFGFGVGDAARDSAASVVADFNADHRRTILYGARTVTAPDHLVELADGKPAVGAADRESFDEYIFTDSVGDTLRATACKEWRSGESYAAVEVASPSNEIPPLSVHVPPKDAPTIAAAILYAAGYTDLDNVDFPTLKEISE